MDKVKIFVTGANGFIGKNLVKKLVNQEDYSIYTLTRKPFKLKNEENFNFDISDKQKLKEAFESIKPDIVIHLAAAGVKYGEGSLENVFKINSFLAINMLEISKDLKLNPKFIIAGSGFEYSPKNEPLKETDCLNPLSLYGISKATQSLLLKRYKDDFTIFLLRFFSVYGAGESKHRFFPYIISEGIKGNKIKLTGCEQVRDYLNVEDAVDCIVEFIKKEEKYGFYDFNVATGKEITLKEIVEMVKDNLQKLGFSPDIEFGALPYRKDEPMYYVADISKITKYLDWRPTISIEEGIRKMIEEELNEIGR